MVVACIIRTFFTLLLAAVKLTPVTFGRVYLFHYHASCDKELQMSAVRAELQSGLQKAPKKDSERGECNGGISDAANAAALRENAQAAVCGMVFLFLLTLYALYIVSAGNGAKPSECAMPKMCPWDVPWMCPSWVGGVWGRLLQCGGGFAVIS